MKNKYKYGIVLVLFVIMIVATFSACWFNTFKVKFDLGTSTQTVEVQEIDYNNLVTRPHVEDEGSLFVSSWYTNPDFEGESWNFDVDTVKNDMTLYAKWEPIVSYNITIMSNYLSDGGEFSELTTIQTRLHDRLTQEEVVPTVRESLGIKTLTFIPIDLYTDRYFQTPFNVDNVESDTTIYIKLSQSIISNAMTEYAVYMDFVEPFKTEYFTDCTPTYGGLPSDINSIFSGLAVTFNFTDPETSQPTSAMYYYNTTPDLFECGEVTSNVGEHNVVVKFAGLYANEIQFNFSKVAVSSIEITPPVGEILNYYYKTVPNYKATDIDSKWTFRLIYNNGESEYVDGADFDITIPTYTSGTSNYDVTFTYSGEIERAYNASTKVKMSFYDESVSEGLFLTSTIGQRVVIQGLKDPSVVRTELIIPQKIGNVTVATIAKDAFKNNTNLMTVYIPETVMSIGEGAFEGCTRLKNIKLINDNLSAFNVTSLSNRMFYNCSMLESVAFWSKITSVGNETFANCTTWDASLTNLTSIGDRAFLNCPLISDISISSRLTNIGNQAFSSSYGTRQLDITITSLSSLVNLDSVFVADASNGIGAVQIDSLTLSLNISYAQKLDIFKSMPIGEWIVSGGVPAEFFKDNLLLTKITLNDPLTIGASAFSGCTNLSSLKIDNSVSSYVTIGESAFYNCSKLSEIAYRNNGMQGFPKLFHLGANAFNGSSITGMTITGGNISPIGVFANTPNLKGVTLINCVITSADTLNSDGNKAYVGLFENSALIRATIDTNRVPAYMFYNCNSLETISITRALSLGREAFYGTSLTTFDVWRDLQRIDDGALNGIEVKKINVSNSHTSFYYESGLLFNSSKTELYKSETETSSLTIALPDRLTKIAERAFENTKYLKTIILVGYLPPQFGLDWMADSSIETIICNPFNAEAYQEVLPTANALTSTDDYYIYSFDPKLGEEEIQSVISLSIASTTITTDDIPTSDEEYNKVSLDGESTLASFPCVISENTMFVANYTGTNYYKITYELSNVNEVSLPQKAPIRVREGKSVDLLNPTKTNYVFNGWVKKGTTEIVESCSYATMAGNITLCDTWVKQYNINLSYGSGISVGSCSEWLRETNSVTLPIPSRTNYEFEGWLYNGTLLDSTLIEYSDFTAEDGSTLTFTPKWYGQYQIRLSLGSGETVGSCSNWLRETASITLPIPARSGYTFKGWKYNGRVVSNTLSYSNFSVTDGSTLIFTSSWWGTSSDPYLISSKAELSAVSTSNYYYSLQKSINIGSISSAFIPTFNGVFLGNNYLITYTSTISGDTLSGNRLYYGVFGNNSGTIQKLNVIATFDSVENHNQTTYINVGGLAGYNTGYISDCTVKMQAIIRRENAFVGGIVGRSTKGSLTSCTAILSQIRGNGDLGGIAGNIYSTDVINCEVKADGSSARIEYYFISENHCCGGIIGFVDGGSRMNVCTVRNITVAYVNPSKSGSTYLAPRLGIMIGRIIASSTNTNSAYSSYVNAGTLQKSVGGFIGIGTTNQKRYIGAVAGGNIGQSESSTIN